MTGTLINVLGTEAIALNGTEAGMLFHDTITTDGDDGIIRIKDGLND